MVSETSTSRTTETKRSGSLRFAFVERFVLTFLREFDSLTADAYQARFELVKDGLAGSWPRNLLLKTSTPWEYQDAIHEHLNRPPGSTIELITSGVHVNSYHDSARNQPGPRVKYGRDIEVIKRELKRDPEHRRFWFYLGQACAAADRIDEAIAAYEKRASFDDVGDEDNWFSRFQCAALREYRGDHWHDVASAYIEAYDKRPIRAEPLWAAAVLYNDRGFHAAAEMFARKACGIQRPYERHIVNDSIYRWRAAWELANALAAQGKLGEARKILERMLELDFVPDEQKAEARINLEKLDELEAA